MSAPQFGAFGGTPCDICGRRQMTVYTLNGVPFGCAACLGEFFGRLAPVKRPWRMTFWDDVKAMFGRS